MVVAVNKADLLSPDRAQEQGTVAQRLVAVDQVHVVSALTGEGLTALVEQLASLLPEGPRYFPEGMLTDQPEEVLVAEFVREQVLAVTEEEVPHAIAVEVLDMEPRPAQDLLYIRAAIYVERDSQRPIILGEGGCGSSRSGRKPVARWSGS